MGQRSFFVLSPQYRIHGTRHQGSSWQTTGLMSRPGGSATDAGASAVAMRN
jgi:hypothetical protein